MHKRQCRYAILFFVASGETQVFELTMSPDLLQIQQIDEVLTMTFGEIRRAYYILVAAEGGPFAAKAGMATKE